MVSMVWTGCAPRPAPESVYVGHLVALNGPDRTAGEHARQGVRLAVLEATEAHQEAAGHPLAVVHVDTQGDAEQVQAETVRLLTVNRVAALLAGPRAASAERVLRADQPYGVPVVVPGELPEAAVPPGVRTLGAPPADRGRALAHFASRDLKAGRAVALTDTRDLVAAAVAAAFTKAWPGGDKAGVEEWSFASNADADGLAARAARARPDIVLLACAPGDLHRLRTGLAEAGYRGAVLYGGQDNGPISGGVESGPDVYLASVYFAEKWTARGQAFARHYDAEFHEAPDLFAAQAYDGACLLFAVLQRAPNRTPTVLREELERLESFETVTGPVTWKDRRTRRALYLLHLKDGKTRLLGTVEPEGQ
jgi:branched-chain amino acid transport system substrate-binding protein